MPPKKLPVITCADCGFRGRGDLRSSVQVARTVPFGAAQGKHISGVVVSVQGERVKLYCPKCGGANTRLAKSKEKNG